MHFVAPTLGVASRHPPPRENGRKVRRGSRRAKDYTAIRYVGRHTYQAVQAAAEPLPPPPNCAIKFVLAAGDLDCIAGHKGHLWNDRRRVSLSSQPLKILINPAICGSSPCQAQSLRLASG